jgi:quinoprotein glucose dehydrogenase
VQGNKTGFVYVLNRDTGAPVFPVEERPVPKSDVPGEAASPTQPFPVSLPAVSRQHVSSDDAWGATPEDRDACRARMAGLRNEGIFTPPSLQGSLVLPAHVGGMNWSGYAYDASRHLLIVNTNNLAAKVKLIPQAVSTTRATDGEGRAYGQAGTPYGMFRTFLMSPGGLPCIAPPWGTLTALDLASGTIRWQVPLGASPANPNVPPAASAWAGRSSPPAARVHRGDRIRSSVRSTSKRAGAVEGGLPFGGHATPMTFQTSNGGSMVIAAGGHGKIDEQPVGDALVAFALP